MPLITYKRLAHSIGRKVVRKLPFMNGFLASQRAKKTTSAREAIADHGEETAELVTQVLLDSDIEVMLYAGSLLGAVREGKFLEHDFDRDFSVIVTDEDIWQRIEHALGEAGYTLVRQYEIGPTITEQAYQADGFTFDIFGLFEVSGGRLRAYYQNVNDLRLYHSETERSLRYADFPKVDSVRKATLGSANVLVAGNAEDILAVHYGPGWRNPDPAWPTGKGWARDREHIGNCTSFKAQSF